MEQLQNFVEAGRVAGAWCAYREQSGEIAGDDFAGEHRLAGRHPVAIALNGVDLPVVGDQSVRVRQGPRGEGVGRES